MNIKYSRKIEFKIEIIDDALEELRQLLMDSISAG